MVNVIRLKLSEICEIKLISVIISYQCDRFMLLDVTISWTFGCDYFLNVLLLTSLNISKTQVSIISNKLYGIITRLLGSSVNSNTTYSTQRSIDCSSMAVVCLDGIGHNGLSSVSDLFWTVWTTVYASSTASGHPGWSKSVPPTAVHVPEYVTSNSCSW